MDLITIIGAGLAGVRLVEALRRRQMDCPVRLIDKNRFFIARKDTVTAPADITRRLDLSEWAKNNNVEFVQSKVERVNTKKSKISCKSGESFEFKRLVVASGLCSKKLPIKGDHREGFFYLSDINPLIIRDLIKISREATVYISTWLGIQLAAALSNLKLEVLAVSGSFDFLGQRKERVLDYLTSKNVGIYEGYAVEEAVGEASLKAVKLSPLKVLSSQFVFIDSGFSPCLDFFEETVIIQDKFFSNFPNIYFLGDVNQTSIEARDYYIGNDDNVIKQVEAFSDFLASGNKPLMAEPLENISQRDDYFARLMLDSPQAAEADENFAGKSPAAE